MSLTVKAVRRELRQIGGSRAVPYPGAVTMGYPAWKPAAERWLYAVGVVEGYSRPLRDAPARVPGNPGISPRDVRLPGHSG
jgi:hypothetical protein